MIVEKKGTIAKQARMKNAANCRTHERQTQNQERQKRCKEASLNTFTIIRNETAKKAITQPNQLKTFYV